MLLNSLRGREGGGGGGLDIALLEAWPMGSTSESTMNKVARRVHLTCLQLHAALHAPLFEKHSHCKRTNNISQPYVPIYLALVSLAKPRQV